MGEQRAAEFKPQPHGQIGMRKSGVYYCTDCGQNINSPGCRPTFDSLLNDPAQQLDTEGVVIASVLSEQERDRLRGEEGMSEKHSDEKDAPYRVDPKRERLHEPTGIYVRAKHGERWGIHDIAVLDTDSLFRFFRSRDGDILWVPHDLPPPPSWETWG